jgi:hypothetical protein
MNVILVTGIYDHIPARSLGVYLLRHYLKKRGYTCQVIDHCQEFSAERLYKMISKFVDSTTLCVGFSTTFWRDPEQRIWKNDQGLPPNIYNTTKLLKDNFPDLRIILGGAGLRNVGSKTEYIDNIVVGESEDLLPELLDFWSGRGPEPSKKLNTVTNKYYYDTPLKKNHDISKCDFEWVDEDCIMPGESLPLETARGCIFKCRFCSYPHLGKKKFDYLKPIDNIKNHLIRNYERWGVTKYTVIDDTFNDSEQKIDEFLSMSSSLPFELNYVAYIRVDLVHRFEGMAEKLLDSGLRACFFGLESLHPQGSMAVGKGWSGKYAREYVPHLISDIWKNKVNVTTGFIAGLPGEGKDSLLDTLKWVNDNNISTFWLGLGIASPDALASRSLDGNAFTSEFERNSEIYGYKFDSHGNWYNGMWSKKSAEDFANQQLNPFRKNKRLSCWVHIQLGSLGLREDEIWDLANSGKRHIEVITDNSVLERKQHFINNYERRVLSL